MSEKKRLTPQEKFDLVIGSYQCDNVADFCREKGVDRSYLYQLRREHQAVATGAWESKKPGRPPVERDEVDSESVKELQRRLGELEEQLDDAKFESALAGLIIKKMDSWGAFDDKQIKKKLPKPALDLLSEMQLRASLKREKDSPSE